MAGSHRWRTTALLAALAACSPTLDWREVQVDGAALTSLFPCRVQRRERELPLAGERVKMNMAACAAGGSTFAVAYADAADAARVETLLRALQQAAVGNIGAAEPRIVPFTVRGASPHPAAARMTILGRLPDGAAVRQEAAFFARGVRAYQASVIGGAPTAEAVETFFGALRFAP